MARIGQVRPVQAAHSGPEANSGGPADRSRFSGQSECHLRTALEASQSLAQRLTAQTRHLHAASPYEPLATHWRPSYGYLQPSLRKPLAVRREALGLVTGPLWRAACLFRSQQPTVSILMALTQAHLCLSRSHALDALAQTMTGAQCIGGGCARLSRHAAQARPISPSRPAPEPAGPP